MRYLLLFFISVCPGFLLGQTKGDNLITLTTEKTAKSNYVDFGRFLINKGYEIRTKDDTFLKLSTRWNDFEYKTGKTTYRKKLALNLVFFENKINCTATYKSKGGRGMWAEFDDKKPWSSEPFNVIEELFKEYGGEISYGTK